MEGIRGKSKGKGLEREGEEKFSNQEILERISKERMKMRKEKKRRQIKESNGSCHWEGLKLMRKKRVKKVKKRRDKYILKITYYLREAAKKRTKKIN